jgi:hypothetical protein
MLQYSHQTIPLRPSCIVGEADCRNSGVCEKTNKVPRLSGGPLAGCIRHNNVYSGLEFCGELWRVRVSTWFKAGSLKFGTRTHV